MKHIIKTICAASIALAATPAAALIIGVFGEGSPTPAGLASLYDAQGFTADAYAPALLPDAALIDTLDVIVAIRVDITQAVVDRVADGALLITEWDASVSTLNTFDMLDATDNGGGNIGLGTMITLTAEGLAAGLGADLPSGAWDSPNTSTQFFRTFGAIGPSVEVLATRPGNIPVLLGGTFGSGRVLVAGWDWQDQLYDAVIDTGNERFLFNALTYGVPVAQPPTEVPVPATALLLLLGLVALAAASRRRPARQVVCSTAMNHRGCDNTNQQRLQHGESPMRSFTLAALLLGSAISTAHAAPISGQGTWESTLQGRDLDGNAATFEAYYDTTLDITWLADANAAGTTLTWADANAWADALDVNGVTGWRLPTVAPIDGASFNTGFSNNGTTDYGTADADGWIDDTGVPVSEMGHMYYVTLGNLGFCTPNDATPGDCVEQTGWGLSNTADFLNVHSSRYWSGTESSAFFPWYFNFDGGNQNRLDEFSLMFAWAVRSGDVSAAAVPVPGVLGLFGIGLVGLLGAARRRR